MEGYDEKNKLLLPPRAAGESLPEELLEYYKEYCSQQRDDGSFRHIYVHQRALISHACRCLPTESVRTWFNLIFLCLANLEASLDETGTIDTTEEDNNSCTVDSRETGMHSLTARPDDFCECIHFWKQNVNQFSWILTSWLLLQCFSFVHSVLSEITPVARAIARHMCIDLSPEGLAARKYRGIAIIVYGAPLTGEAIHNN